MGVGSVEFLEMALPMKLKFYTDILNGSEGHVWKSQALSSIWAQITGKKGFFRLSHFFYVEANLRISYMGTFFEAIMVLKLCNGYLVHITEYIWKFFAILPIRARIMGKKGFFQKWDLVSER